MKKYTISLRVDEVFLNKLDLINQDLKIGSYCSPFDKSINKSYLIEKAIDLLFKLDLSDRNTFMNVFGFTYFDNYEACCNTKKEFILKKLIHSPGLYYILLQVKK